ncbi:aryl hydrocarbon receptor-like [Saccoglossus kowalevskii]|uniref:Aryl hydrocarbon receptor-like n=1 Tax=Saccoglossus kowalevskii TaxID=10224 RepID=A0ABM0M7U3_SACKO|nr:PREDICTED: aryl hydrocarbon receptor-like [Saccoglossus kowalevskii]
MYAGRKRRRPVKRVPRNLDNEVKSNPSKRHRDRLNKELDNLAALLPFDEDVISKLDKLSILRLSVSYLRNKSFFQSVISGNGVSNKAITVDDCYGNQTKVPPISTQPQNRSCLDGEGELLLQALNGFMIVVSSDGIIFYASPTIYDFLGFHQSDVMNQSVFEIIHTEDRNEFRRQLGDLTITSDQSGANQVITPGDSLPAQDMSNNAIRNFVTRFRCLLDNSSGFLALHFTGKLRPLYGQNHRHDDSGVMLPDNTMALFTIACPLQPPSIIEIHTRNIIFRSKHKLDFKPLSMDPRGLEYLGYNDKDMASAEKGYNMVHFEDLLYCAEQHGNLLRKGETGFIYFRLMTKHGSWLWVQAKGRIIFKNSKPDYIISTHRPMSEEEGMQHYQQRGNYRKFPFSGPAVLYDCNEPRPPFIPQGMDFPYSKGVSNPGSDCGLRGAGGVPQVDDLNGAYVNGYNDCTVKMENVHLAMDADHAAMSAPMVTDTIHHPVAMTAAGMQEHDYRMSAQAYYGLSYSNDGYGYHRNYYANQHFNPGGEHDGYRDSFDKGMEMHRLYSSDQRIMQTSDNILPTYYMNYPTYRVNSTDEHVTMETSNGKPTQNSHGLANPTPACQFEHYNMEEAKPSSYRPNKQAKTKTLKKTSAHVDGRKDSGNYSYSSCCLLSSSPEADITLPNACNLPYMQISAADGKHYYSTVSTKGNMGMNTDPVSTVDSCNAYTEETVQTPNPLLNPLPQPLLSFSALADTLLGTEK